MIKKNFYFIFFKFLRFGRSLDNQDNKKDSITDRFISINSYVS